MTKKRERLEVIYDILKVIQNNNNSVKPTRLLYASNLSPQMFKEYVDELVQKKLVLERDDDGKKSFSLTTKGFEFLEKYKVIVEFIENFGL
jgi:predicted transcriptional regulator